LVDAEAEAVGSEELRRFIGQLDLKALAELD
jgi:hypothetical protein